MFISVGFLRLYKAEISVTPMNETPKTTKLTTIGPISKGCSEEAAFFFVAVLDGAVVAVTEPDPVAPLAVEVPPASCDPAPVKPAPLPAPLVINYK
jgi:hypothetical protein